MKRTYIAPMAETIKLNLSSSVLEGAGVGKGSVGGDATTMQAKQFNTWNFDDEEEEKQSNIGE
nr:hypothetical protein [uncultured Prevotella sp.]